MPVFHEHKLIFYHIGKTGGMSICSALGFNPKDYTVYLPEYVHGVNRNVMTQHARPRYVSLCINTQADNDYYKFTIVRNPWDRLVSCYYYLYNIHTQRHGDFTTWLNKFVYNHVKSKRYLEGDHLTPQLEYTHDQQNQQIVNYIGRYETLQQSFDHVCIENNIPRSELTVKNYSGKRRGIKYRECYTPADADLVYELYAPEIEQYGYVF